jgi:flagellin
MLTKTQDKWTCQMVIGTNISAMTASRLLVQSSQAQRRSLGRLASGSRILSPEDDAAGLAVAFKTSALAQRDNAAQRNLENSISFAQTQDGYLQKTQKALDRMSELAVLAQDVTKTDKDRANYDSEFQKLATFITEAGQAKFNGVDLFVSPTGAGFSGSYAPGNWTETKVNNTDGSTNTAGAPTSIILTGPDDGGTNGEENFTITAQAGGTVSFNWTFSSADPGGGDYDTAGYLINGVYTKIVNIDSQGSGSSSFTVSAGDTFGFSARASDNTLGPGTFTISNLVAPGATTSTNILTDGDGSTKSFEDIQPLSISGSVSTSSSAASALNSAKDAINILAARRAQVGAKIATLQSYVGNVAIQEENLRAAVSRITDTDVAEESTQFARSNILVQSGTAMLAQANLLPQSVLRLLS